MNWHYLKVNVDLAERRFLGFQCNDLIYTGDPLKVHLDSGDAQS